jgi:hypothetical protein
MYSTEGLKSLSDYLKTTAKEALKGEPPDQEGHDQLMEVARQLEAIRYNPLLFKTILKKYQIDYGTILEKPLKQVPLHINDAGILSKTIVQWRCTNKI